MTERDAARIGTPDQAAIVAETEARIVAWLRIWCGSYSDVIAAQKFATAIEAGEHKEPTP
jgi:hypothetical protein